jgi:hypothetical protein
MPDLTDVFADARGKPIEGGCRSCNAVQVLQANGPDDYVLTVLHDSLCPVLKAVSGRTK